MIPLSSCCNHPYNYKHLGNKEAEDHSNRGEEEEKMEEGPIRRSEGGAAGADVVLNVDSQSEDFNQERAMGGGSREGGGIWRGSSYDFLGESEKLGLPTAQGASDDKSQSFDFREGRDPPSKLIGDFLQRERISGQKSLDMDFDLEELHFAQEGDNSVSGKKRDYLSSVPETHTLQSGANSPGKGVVRSHLHGGSSPTPNSSMHARSPSASPKAQFQYGGEAASEMAYVSRRRSGQLKSGQLKSGIIGKNPGMLEKLNEDEEDDPFKDCDLPDEYKRAKWGFLGLFQWLSFFVIVGAFVCSLTVEYLKRKTVWDLHLWKWCLLVLVLFCGRLVSGWAIRLVVFFVERNFLLRKRVLYFVYGLRKAVQNCLWLGLVLLAWHYLFDKKVERETKSKSLRYVNKILVCLLVGTFIWLIKTLLVKVLASSFHVSTFFDRIQESLFNQYVLETLSGPPLIEIEQYNKEEEKLMAEIAQMKEAGAKIAIDLKSTSKSGLLKSGATTPRSGMIGKSGRSMGLRDNKQQDEGISIDHLHKLNQKNISAWNMKRLMNIVRHGVLSTLDESFQNAATEDESVTQIRSEWEAKAAAKKIFRNVAQPRAKHITIEDLMRFLREEEALKAMALFEGAQDTNQVNKAALKNWVVNVFRERRALALTLNDTKTAVNKLHRMVNVAVSLVIGVIWLLILGIATTHILVLISSQLLLVVFVFGNTCKTIFESIIFLFVMHPFDVGDRCSVEGVQMVVEEMNILTTVFLRYDNEKIWYPNSVLATKPISNFYRSPDMGDAVEFAIHIATPKEKVDIMKERIKRYVDNKVEHWYPNPMIVVKDIEDMNRMKMAVWLQHKMNHQDMGEKWLRRSHLVEEMITIFRDLDIEYRLLPMDVNIRKLPPPALVSNRLPSTWMT
ncbi:hypothetical protein SUGI_0832660 [Cryptomeria japonica]|nr:hypothetical protein SUGI_0832660 [Cryptomeria japonica]